MSSITSQIYGKNVHSGDCSFEVACAIGGNASFFLSEKTGAIIDAPARENSQKIKRFPKKQKIVTRETATAVFLFRKFFLVLHVKPKI